MAYDRASCVDSVLDSYADMYGSDEEQTNSNYDEEETEPSPPLDELEYDEDEEEVEHKEESPVEKKEPWDQRGKNGLYGGGGRGADNTETGWVSEYESEAPDEQQRAIQVQDTARSSFEDQEDNYLHPTSAAVAKPFLPSHPNYYQTHHKRPSSSGTDYSSYGPITPIDTNFPASSHIQPVLGYQTLYNPPAILELQPTPDKLASAIVFPAPPHLRQHRELSVPNIGSPLIASPEMEGSPRRQSEPTTPLTDSPRPAPSPLRKKPIHHGPLVGAKPLQTTAHDVVVKSKKLSGTFRWSGRSKKAPTISNPILPDGFVESLGMSTFELTPGGLPAPVRAVAAPKAASKEVQKVVSKPSMEKMLNTAPLRPLRSTSSLEKMKVKPTTADVSAPRTIENSPRDFRLEMSEAFKRLSDNSDVSHYAASSLASIENSRQLYFNGLRDRSSATVEVQANRREVPFSAHNKPPVKINRPLSSSRPKAPPVLSSDHPSSPDSQPTPKPAMFRDPWLNKSQLSSTPPASAAPSPRSAPGQKNIPVVRSSYGIASSDTTASPSSQRSDSETKRYIKTRNDSEATLTIKLNSRAIETRRGSVTPPTPTNLNTRRPSHDYRQSMNGLSGLVIATPVHHISLVPEEASPKAGWEPGW